MRISGCWNVCALRSVLAATLDVLRNGVEMHPVRGKIALAQFCHASGIKEAIMARWKMELLCHLRTARLPCIRRFSYMPHCAMRLSCHRTLRKDY